jgi:transketolase
MDETKNLHSLATLLRRDVLEMTTAAQSGHPSSCLSAADIVTALFFHTMKYDMYNAHNPDNDEFVLSKGHAAPLLYAALKRAGCINLDLLSLRKQGSALEGHPTPSLAWVKAATGSLGQGLSIGVGMALAAKLQKRQYKTYVLLGDSECSEGAVYEAAQLAAHYKLNNLVAIIDVNGLGQRGETMLAHNVYAYKKRFEDFGWSAVVVNGHSIKEIIHALTIRHKKPLAIIARTIKGKGISFMEGKDGWHGRALTEKELHNALVELPLRRITPVNIVKPIPIMPQRTHSKHMGKIVYSYAEMFSTREAYGNALKRIISQNPHALVLDAEVSNSTFAETAKKAFPEQFLEMYIAEQNMIDTALGLAVKGHKVFASSFAAFLSRAHDQLRMASVSNASFVVNGSHAGCSIGQDGASQMGLEDITLFRSLPNSVVLCPSDAIATEKLTDIANSNNEGITYIRTTRPKTPIIHNEKDNFKLGAFGIVQQSKKDKLVLAGSGVTLSEALKAATLLEKKGIKTAVVDIYCVKPFNKEAFRKFVKEHGKRFVIAEDHYAEGGIGEMLSSVLAGTNTQISHLAVNSVPHSCSSIEQLAAAKIDAAAIAAAAKKLLKR